YKGEIPLAHWLKHYFRQHKKYGSRDRKQIAHLCYCYYRLGRSFQSITQKERLTIALFLCSQTPNSLLEQLAPHWNSRAGNKIEEKLSLVHGETEVQNIFPCPFSLTDHIDKRGFLNSLLVQPDMFLRLRPGREEGVKMKLRQAQITFQEISPQCIALPNGTSVENVLHLDKEAVVQDLSSQQTLNALFSHLPFVEKELVAWDCCAASGGKSILLYDHFQNSRLIVSDIRESILSNLRKRFERAGITNYKWMVADLTKEKASLHQKFDVIICDAPCSGSGTWSRTPEQLYFFEAKRIEYYATIQKAILKNVVSHLKSNGFLVYITCSVFKEENEGIVQFILDNGRLSLKNMEYITGYHQKADTLFTALFQRSEVD
ncbi:MAG: methyltransferase domain-containing protein, partial [Flavisolibacter sp.]|nr:methyltransferase domain-containing protein [Flavisolibacter sp.]